MLGRHPNSQPARGKRQEEVERRHDSITASQHHSITASCGRSQRGTTVGALTAQTRLEAARLEATRLGATGLDAAGLDACKERWWSERRVRSVGGVKGGASGLLRRSFPVPCFLFSMRQ